MKQYTAQKDLPPSAHYIGTISPNGYVGEDLDNAINSAVELAFIDEDDGARSYFDMQG